MYNISYLGDNFKEWFDEFPKPKKIDLQFKTLERSMNDQEILSEFKPEEISLAELAYVLDKNLLDKNNWFICYIKDKSGVLRAVYVRWIVGGWRGDAGSVEFSLRWDAGSRVFSSKFLSLNSSDPLELGLLERVRILEDWKKRVEEVLKV